jgi:ParB/RepB/Spo0J family partition protein
VRFDYSDIEELAESVKKNGQLEPALVKAMETDADGIEKFELVAGHRRFRALQHLCASGESFTTIDALVVTGDKLTIQLVENLQRSDLTAAERERGIFEMCQNGVPQKEVAARLSKSAEYVSRNIAAFKIREAANAAGIDTSGLATATLNEIQAAAAADYPELVREVLCSGGTLDAARSVMEIYRVEHGKPANPKAKPQAAALPENTGGGISDPLALHPSPALDQLVEQFSGEGDAVDVDMGKPETPSLEKPAEKTAPKPTGAKPASARSWLDEFVPPEHKQVDFNSVCLAVFKYAKEAEDVVKACEIAKCETCDDHCTYFYRLEVARDIMALLEVEL